MRRWPTVSGLLASLLVIVAACFGHFERPRADADVDSGPDACAGVTCSDHGRCVENEGVPSCHCDPGYEAVGLRCVPISSDGDGDVDGDSDGDIDGDSDGDSDGDVDGDVDADADEPVDGDIDADIDAGCVPVGHDEDGDGVDDACDNCPTFGNGRQRDLDGDGLGTQCEWTDGAILSEIAFFDPFIAPSATWVFDSTSWAVASDELAGRSYPYGENAIYLMPFDGPFVLETSFLFDASAPADHNGFACVMFGHVGTSPRGESFWECCLDWQDLELQLWRLYGAALDVRAQVAVEDSSSRGEWRRLRVYFDGVDRVECRLETDGHHVGTLEYDVDISLPTMDGNVGVRVYNDQVAFSSFVVYR